MRRHFFLSYAGGQWMPHNIGERKFIRISAWMHTVPMCVYTLNHCSYTHAYGMTHMLPMNGRRADG